MGGVYRRLSAEDRKIANEYFNRLYKVSQLPVFCKKTNTNYYKKDGVLTHAAGRTRDSVRESPARLASYSLHLNLKMQNRSRT